MPCYHPITGYRSKAVSKNGKRVIVFNAHEGYIDLPVTVPCGQCSGCRLERSRQWAIRCVHEAQLHSDNCFITLTYNNEHLPKDRSLDPRSFQLFIKKLRKSQEPKKIRYFHCGEYGDLNGRPHYHAILFGHDFEDKHLWMQNRDNPIYRSPTLEKTWGMGYCSIGEVTFKSAAYVARYIMKKRTGPNAKDYYGDLHPEYTTMSRRPGVGKNWLEKYSSDVYPGDFIILENKKLRPPRYYDSQNELKNEQEHNKIKRQRKRNLKKHKHNNTPERLKVRETIHEKQIERLQRNLKG